MLAENALFMFRRSGWNVFFGNVEGSPRHAHLCSQGNIDAQRFRNGFFRVPNGRRLQVTWHLADARIFDDTAGITVGNACEARRLAAEQKRLDLIVVDYLQLMSGSAKRFESRQQEVRKSRESLKGWLKN